MHQFQGFKESNCSIKPLIRVSRFDWEIPSCSEDINKSHTEFPQRGISPRSGIHSPSIDYIFLTRKLFLYIDKT